MRFFVFIGCLIWLASVAGPVLAQTGSSPGKKVQTQGMAHGWYRSASRKIYKARQNRKFSLALQETQALLNAVRREFGAGSFDTAVILSSLGHIYSSWNKPAKAASSYAQSLALMETLFGSTHAQVAIMQANLAKSYGASKQIDKSRALFDKAMAVAVRASGAQSDTVRQVLGLYAVFNANHGEKKMAEQQLIQLIELARTIKGTRSTALIKALKNYATLLAVLKKWKKLDRFTRITIEDASETLGASDTFTIQLTATFAKIYSRIGQARQAAKLYQSVVELSQTRFGLAHKFTVANTVLLANSRQENGQDEEAVRLYDKAIANWEQAFGKSYYRIHDVYLRLGISLRRRSQFVRAEAAFKAAIEVSKKAFGKLHIYNAKPQLNLAGLYKQIGRLREAEELYKYALTASRKRYGKQHSQIALTLDNLATLYIEMGRYTEAEALARKSLVMFERTGKANGKHLVFVLNNLSTIYSKTNRSTEALRFLTRALAIVNNTKSMRNHPIIGILLDNMASIFSQRGRKEKAAKFRNKAYEFLLRTHGRGHVDVAIAAQNLGVLHLKLKNYGLADQWFTQVLATYEKIYGRNHRSYAATLRQQAQVLIGQQNPRDARALLLQALKTFKMALPNDHPDIVATLANLGEAEALLGNFSAAHKAYLDASMLVRRRQRLLRTTRNATTIFRGLIDTAYSLRSEPNQDQEKLHQTAFDAAQRINDAKAGSALAQMSARFAVGDDALARAVRKSQDLSHRLDASERRLTSAIGTRRDSAGDRLVDKLRKQRNRLAKALESINDNLRTDFPKFADLSRPGTIGLSETTALLGKDEILVQFEINDKGSYVWTISQTQTSWHRLALDKPQIEALIVRLRCGLDATAWDTSKPGRSCRTVLAGAPIGNNLPFDILAARNLYEGLFGTIKTEIKQKHLILVLSDALTSLPFHVLVTKPHPTRFITDPADYAKIHWLATSIATTVLPSASSLKALRRFAGRSKAKAPYIGYGDPVLVGSSYCPRIEVPKNCTAVSIAPASTKGQQLSSLETFFRAGRADASAVSKLCPLPDTSHELRCVARSLGVGPDNIHTGYAATETLLKSASAKGLLQDYRVIHFATHGLLAGETRQLNQTLAEPALVLTPPVKPTRSDDGLLTASEIALLKLDADWVVLSACNTAAGDRPGAEALSGLARAFFYAGARAILVSHWPVASSAAVKLTSGAFDVMRNAPTTGRAEALRLSMVALIEHGQAWEAHPSYWAPFVVVGEGAIAAKTSRSQFPGKTEIEPHTKSRSLDANDPNIASTPTTITGNSKQELQPSTTINKRKRRRPSKRKRRKVKSPPAINWRDELWQN